MLIAAIDNSLDLLNITVADDERILVEQVTETTQTVSEVIAKAFSPCPCGCRSAHHRHRGTLRDPGPGSFTGIRVSLAFCKGISAANNVPLVGVPTLDVLARNLSYRTGHFLCPLVDARKGEVFMSLYSVEPRELKRLAGYHAVRPEQVSEMIQKPCICFGTGLAACERFLNAVEGVSSEEGCHQVTAEALIKTGLTIMRNGPPYETKPIYGRKSEAEIKFNVTVD